MRHFLLASVTAFILTTPAVAGEVKVNWHEPEKFTDIRPASETKARYQEKVQNHFETFFNELAAKLPDGYTWQVTVTDIDLAGDVDYFVRGDGQPIRVVKELYSPAIKFSYVLKDQHGEEILAADEQIRDMAFMSRTATLSRNTEFEYEKRMLNDWFSKGLLPKLEQVAKN